MYLCMVCVGPCVDCTSAFFDSANASDFAVQLIGLFAVLLACPCLRLHGATLTVALVVVLLLPAFQGFALPKRPHRMALGSGELLVI